MDLESLETAVRTARILALFFFLLAVRLRVRTYSVLGCGSTFWTCFMLHATCTSILCVFVEEERQEKEIRVW